MKFRYDDGGRKRYFKGQARDCATRAIAIATGEDYKKIYREHDKAAKSEPVCKGKKPGSAKTGIYIETIRRILAEKDWEWHPTMSFGSGCRVHMKKSEIPSGVIIVRLSRHLACVKDGVLYDTYDCSRGGKRCVYGYWINMQKKENIC